ncbi:MAG: gamma-glutamylcyclotransferase [Pedobacter sp.]|nr:MAG: gamma-glutamylcyclotransferase [Pedobacter sp.]
MELLFSYGTLQKEKVQLQSFGRLLKGEADELLGYRLHSLHITDAAVLEVSEQVFHPIAQETGNPDDRIAGMVFEITEDELKAADVYEVSDYKRVMGNMASGKRAWVYVEV